MKNTVILLILVVLASVGCAGTSWTKPDISALKPAGAPAKALAVWEPAVKLDGDTKPVRGFGGRVYFYDADGKKPVKVNGNVVVYAFDEDGRKIDDNKPTQSFIFEKKDVKKLYSKSKLGHSYNFWIPWDEEGPDGKAKKVSLIVRYVPDVGTSVVSSQATAYLPGKLGQGELTPKADWDNVTRQEGTIQQVAHLSEMKTPPAPQTAERVIEANANRPVTMQTTTINKR